MTPAKSEIPPPPADLGFHGRRLWEPMLRQVIWRQDNWPISAEQLRILHLGLIAFDEASELQLARDPRRIELLTKFREAEIALKLRGR